MTLVQEYIENAENCVELAENAKDEPTRLRYRRLRLGFLANEQEWLPPLSGMSNGHGNRPTRV